MGIPAPFTAVHNTPNKSLRQNVPRRGVVLHHAAMTSLSGLRRLAMGAKQVSADAIVKDDDCEQMFNNPRYRAWSLGSAWGDSSFRSVETANESTNGWTISDRSHWTLARVVAYWAEQDGFYPHRNGNPETWTVIGHREAYSIHDVSYATACPGSLDLNLVTRRAQELLKGSSVAGGTGTIIDSKGADVAVRKTFQSSVDFRVRPQWQRFPWQLAPREDNVAQGTGVGLYDVTVNLYLKEFDRDSQIEGRIVVENAASKTVSPDHEFTVDGSVTGNVKAAIPTRFDVPAGSLVFLELRSVAGVEPLLDYWGADIAVLTVAS